MSNSDEIRWQQRLANFKRAVAKLEEACELEEYSELEQAGLVQTFEFSFELAWKTLKDLLFYEGFELSSPREVIKQAFTTGYLNESNTEILLDALEKRNRLAHTYDDETAAEAVRLINDNYFPALLETLRWLEKKRSEG